MPVKPNSPTFGSEAAARQSGGADGVLPAVCPGGHALIISASFYGLSGSAVLMRNLLSGFRSDSYSLVTYGVPDALPGVPDPAHVTRLTGAMPVFGRPIDRWRDACHRFAIARIKQMVLRIKPNVIVAVYPHLHMLAAAAEVAASARVPWIAYFHDTLAEVYRETRYESWARALQTRAFQEASAVLVTGRGMAELFAARYGMECATLEIPYPEEFDAAAPERSILPRSLMAGMIYTVNHCATRRLAETLGAMGCPLVLATGTSRARLNSWGIHEGVAERRLFAGRCEYLAALRRHRILAVALNWPDESTVSEDELATAFPTKAVEYLASGRPILVHCPEHYYLARFFLERRCGAVVSDRRSEALAAAVDSLLGAGSRVVALTSAAAEAATLFGARRIRSLFQSIVSAVAPLSWSQKWPVSDMCSDDSNRPQQSLTRSAGQ